MADDPDKKKENPIGRGPTVAVIGLVVAAVLGVAGMFIAFQAEQPSPTAIVAILGAVLSPIVAIASAYYGIAVSAGVARSADEQLNQALGIVSAQQSSLIRLGERPTTK
jgi:hypothetical protein